MATSLFGKGSTVTVNVNGTLVPQSFTATAGQTVFNITAFTYVVNTNSLLVFINGQKQQSGRDFSETSTSSFTLLEGCVEGDNVDIIGFPQVDLTAVNAGSVILGGTYSLKDYLTDSPLNVKAFPFNAKGNGVTDDTPAFQAAFNAVRDYGVNEIIIPPGTYLLRNPRNDNDYTCAVIISGLRNCTIRGTKGTKFIVGLGTGSAEFGMFRIEQCENLEFCGFELDGSGIVINGTGANRSRGFVLVNYDVNNKTTTLPVLNKNIEFHHITASNIGGFVGIPPRSANLLPTPYTDDITVRDCSGFNLIGQDHFVGVTYTRNLIVRNCRAVNNIPVVEPIDNMMVDASQGCENILIENNYAYGFWFGAKCETATGVGPSGTEIRPSKNALFLNNTFEQIGNPTVFTIPGPFGGDTYGIKLNSINSRAIGNTVSARTIGLSGGGLAAGIQAIGTHAADSHSVVESNVINGALYGINHNDTTPTTRKSSYLIRGNRINSVLTDGLILQSNVIAEDNWIYSAAGCAIQVQSPNNTISRRNIAVDCAINNNAVTGTRVVYYQSGAGAYSGFQAWEDNIIVDSRGASAAHHGYFIRGGTTYSNVLIFRPGYTQGLLTAVSYDTYVSALGFGMQRNGTVQPARREFAVTNNPSISAPWNGMAWVPGDRGVMSPPAVGVPKAWICTVAGTPGTWVSEGNL